MLIRMGYLACRDTIDKLITGFPMIFQKSFLPNLFALTFCLSGTFFGLPVIAASKPESKVVAQARELVDTYYGNRANLIEATELLETAYRVDPNDARVFVEAARITVNGGHLVYDRYEGNTIERYAALLDQAIALDPSNPKAHILKAGVYKMQNKFKEWLAELDKAKALGTSDPWLQVGYGVYYAEMDIGHLAHEAYSSVEKRGPGSTASDRNAYIAALKGLSDLVPRGEKPEDYMRKYAAIALKERYPTDAWTPLAYSEAFVRMQLYDEAIQYARETLKTMNFGAGRLALAASLYAKAATLMESDHPAKESQPYIDEAKALGLSRNDVLDYLVRHRPGKPSRIVATVHTIIPE